MNSTYPVTNSRPDPLRRALLAGGATLVLTASALGGIGAYSVLKPTAAPSAPLSAVPLTTGGVETHGTTPANASGVYAIKPSDSTASFIVDEVLRGSPYTVVGKTDQVAGQLAFDPAHPETAQLGTILVEARTLTTDDANRTRALGNKILNTEQYEYVAFTPTQLIGLPSSVSVDQAFTFQALGDLTIKDVTRPTTFEVTVTPTADGSLDGTAITAIQYADWGVSIPKVPFVASVGDEVKLKLDFSAAANA